MRGRGNFLKGKSLFIYVYFVYPIKLSFSVGFGEFVFWSCGYDDFHFFLSWANRGE